VAAVVPLDATGWLRFQQGLVRYARHPLLPRSRWFRNKAEVYVPVQVMLLVLALTLAKTALWPFCVVMSVAILIDAMVYNSMVVFVTQHPQVPLRSALFVVLTFLTSTACFAVLYSALPDSQFSKPLSSTVAFYFSVVTMATVGFGDIVPSGTVSRLLVTIEIAVGVFFLTTIVSTIASWANSSPGLPTLDDLRR
jgi:hypothetical protein